MSEKELVVAQAVNLNPVSGSYYVKTANASINTWTNGGERSFFTSPVDMLAPSFKDTDSCALWTSQR